MKQKNIDVKEDEFIEIEIAKPEVPSKKMGKVISWDEKTKILIFEHEGVIYQTNSITQYDGSGFIEI